jgi:hypothetical protein
VDISVEKGLVVQESVFKVIIASTILIGLVACSDSPSESDGQKGVVAKSAKVESKPVENDNTKEFDIIGDGAANASEALSTLREQIEGIDTLTSDVVSRLDLPRMMAKYAGVNLSAQTAMVDEANKAWGKAYEEAIAPSRAMIDRVIEDANYESRGTVMVSVGTPQKYNSGYQGQDGYTNRTVYIETTLYAPGNLGPGDRLMPILGNFRRDGEIHGTNSYGAQISVPKYVDPPHQAGDRSRLLRSEHSMAFRSIAEAGSGMVEQKRKDIEAQRKVVLDRFADIWLKQPIQDRIIALRAIDLVYEESSHRLNKLAQDLLLGEWIGPVVISGESGELAGLVVKGTMRVEFTKTSNSYTEYRRYALSFVLDPEVLSGLKTQYEDDSLEMRRAERLIYTLKYQYQENGQLNSAGLYCGRWGKSGYPILTENGIEFTADSMVQGVLAKQD